MALHLYCVLPAADRAPDPLGLHGLAGGEVRALRVDNLVAWVSDVPQGLPVTVDGVKEHDAVVEAALATGRTPLPARFGQRFESDESCGAAIASRLSPVGTLLAEMQGHVEMTLLVTPSTDRMLRELQPIPDADLAVPNGREQMTSGRRYLESLRSRDSSAQATLAGALGVLDQVEQAVAGLVRRTMRHERVTRRPLLTASHLIGRSAVRAYRATATRVQAGPELRLLVIGPRAPYSFCALGEAGSGGHGMNLAD